MIGTILRFLFLFCGGTLGCAITAFGVFYLAWVMSRPGTTHMRGNGWER